MKMVGISLSRWIDSCEMWFVYCEMLCCFKILQLLDGGNGLFIQKMYIIFLFI